MNGPDYTLGVGEGVKISEDGTALVGPDGEFLAAVDGGRAFDPVLRRYAISDEHCSLAYYENVSAEAALTKYMSDKQAAARKLVKGADAGASQVTAQPDGTAVTVFHARHLTARLVPSG